MTTWFISRHAGAIAWAKQQHLPIDRWVKHLDLAEISAGDVVIGTLPVHMAAKVCDKGAEFHFLSLNLRPEQRGHELDANDMAAANCTLLKFLVQEQP